MTLNGSKYVERGTGHTDVLQIDSPVYMCESEAASFGTSGLVL